MSTEHVENTSAAGETAAPETQTTTETVSTPPVTQSQHDGHQPVEHAQAGAETPATEGDTDQPQRESRAKDRIQELVRRAKEAESRATAAETQLKEYQSEPLKEAHEYESDSDYQRALIREELREAERARLQREQKLSADQARLERQNIYDARVQDVRVRIPDFDQVAHSPAVPYSTAMLELVQESDHGPEIAYHFGKNPHEADRVARLSPLSAAREIGRLESRFSQTAPKKVSSAPPPVKTVQGTGAIEQKPLNEVDSIEEYYRRRGFDPTK